MRKDMGVWTYRARLRIANRSAGCVVMLRVGDQAGSSVWRPWMPGQGVETWLHGWWGIYRRFWGQNRTPHTNHFQGQKSPDLWDLLFLSITSSQFHPSEHLSKGKVPCTCLTTSHLSKPSTGSHHPWDHIQIILQQCDILISSMEDRQVESWLRWDCPKRLSLKPVNQLKEDWWSLGIKSSANDSLLRPFPE